MAWRPHGRARIDEENPVPIAICDRCGNLWNHNQLAWQYDWMGPKLQNKRVLVCPDCMDDVAMFLKSLVLPADPPPVYNVRREDFFIDSISNWTLSVLPGAKMFHVVCSMTAKLT